MFEVTDKNLASNTYFISGYFTHFMLVNFSAKATIPAKSIYRKYIYQLTIHCIMSIVLAKTE